MLMLTDEFIKNRTSKYFRKRRFYLQISVFMYKQLHRCKYCRTNLNLQFHHKKSRKGDGKKIVARLVSKIMVLETWQEIAKCEVVCQDCHSKIHNGEISYDHPS